MRITSSRHIFDSHPGGRGFRPVKYMFLTPERLTVIKPDGEKVDMGYGIGDIIEVIEPSFQYCIMGEETDCVPLKGGSVLLRPDRNFYLELVTDSD